MSVLNLFDNSAQLQAAGTIGAGIQQGEQQALPYYQQGIQQLQGYGAQGLAPLNQNFSTLTGGARQLGNLLGLGGAAGNASAYNALQNIPGYQAALGAGNAGVNAAQAATGGTGSGNAILAAQKQGQNLANQNFTNYVQQLQPYLAGIQNTGGQIANTNLGIGQGSMAGQQNIGNMYYGGATSAANALGAAQSNLSGAGNLLNLGLTGAAGLGGFLLSDFKLKENIEPVGALASGETIYRYHFKGDPTTHIGLIAQEIEGSTPEAVVEFMPDLRAVDYHKATERAAKILEFTRERSEPPPTHRPFASELMEFAA